MPEEITKETTENIEENSEELNRRIERLRELVEKEESLHVRKDDNFMLRYLRCSQYDPEASLKKVRKIIFKKKLVEREKVRVRLHALIKFNDKRIWFTGLR